MNREWIVTHRCVCGWHTWCRRCCEKVITHHSTNEPPAENTAFERTHICIDLKGREFNV